MTDMRKTLVACFSWLGRSARALAARHGELNLRRSYATTVSWIAAIFLLGAALLKISAAFTEAYHFGLPSRPDALRWSVLTYGLAFGEIVLALCLINFAMLRPMGLLTAFVFFALFCATLAEGLARNQAIL